MELKGQKLSQGGLKEVRGRKPGLYSQASPPQPLLRMEGETGVSLKGKWKASRLVFNLVWVLGWRLLSRVSQESSGGEGTTTEAWGGAGGGGRGGLEGDRSVSPWRCQGTGNQAARVRGTSRSLGSFRAGEGKGCQLEIRLRAAGAHS